MANPAQLLARASGLFFNYYLGPRLGYPTTAGFWYLREMARYRTPSEGQAYFARPAGAVPLYPMDYSSKLSYRSFDARGILVLPYAPPIGRQINPEAAFIYALACLDDHLASGAEASKAAFLKHAEYFLEAQTPSGDWEYHFDWPGSPAPWTSALAQGRGVSVMTRAWLATDRPDFLEAARRATARFAVPIGDNGYLHRFPPTGSPYYEEYPKRPRGVLNGFMASLIGLLELAHWAGDDDARDLFDMGIESLVAMAPHYLLPFGSVYDRAPGAEHPNVNTPRYHRLCVSYLEVLWALTGDPRLGDHLSAWRGVDTLPNRIRSFHRKFVWKITQGVFIR